MEILISQLRECYGRVVYAHKAHEKCSDIFLCRLDRMKMLQIVLSALTTGTLLGSLLEHGKVAAIVAAAFSTLLLGINAYMKNYDLGSLAQKHADTATSLWDIRECYLSLLTDAHATGIAQGEVAKRRDKLQANLAAIYKGAPRTIGKAYTAAQQALQVNEELTFSDEEIDKFLPVPLRKRSKARPVAILEAEPAKADRKSVV